MLIRMYFHDDWFKIIEKLKDQVELEIHYKLFHAKKALLFFQDESQAKLLCSNKGQTTVGKFHVKFEAWNKNEHSAQKLLPSYGGRTRFKGILLHAWNINNFTQIGDAYGCFMDVARETKEKNKIYRSIDQGQIQLYMLHSNYYKHY